MAPTQPAAARWQLPLLIGIVAIGAVLRFSELSGQSYWFDETVTANLLSGSLGDVFSRLSESESTPPLYYVAAWFWSQLFGTGEAGLRSLSAVAGVGVIPLVWAAGRELLSERAGLIAAALIAVNPMLIWYSQEARAYSLLALLAAASFWLFVRARRTPTMTWLLAWGAVSALAVATHYFAIFLLLPEAAWLLWELRAQRRAVVAACALVALTGLALLPLATSQESDGRTAWIAASNPLDRLWEVLRELLSANTLLVSSASEAPGGVWGLLGLVGVGAAVLLVRPLVPDGGWRAALPALAVGGAAIALPLVLALTPLDFFKDRNLLAAWIPLAVGLGVVLSDARVPRVALGALAAIVVAGLVVSAKVSSEPELQRSNWRSVAAALGEPQMARAVIVRPGYARSVLKVYGHSVAPMPVGARIQEVSFIGSSVLEPGARPAPIAGFQLIERRVVRDLAVLRYRRTRPFTYTQAMLTSSPEPILLEPSADAKRWFERYERLRRSLLASVQTATAPGPARSRLLEAAADVRHIGPPPGEFPIAAGLHARLEQAARLAPEFARNPSPRLKQQLSSALRGA